MTQRCKGGFAVQTAAGPMVYSAGRLVGDGDPILRTHGHLFEPVEALVERQESTPQSVSAAVETATAAPGEVRQNSVVRGARAGKSGEK